MSGVPFTTNPPFGYMKNPDNTKEWVVDEEAAKTVRQIFALCVEGLGPTQIAKRLKAAKVLTPTEYWISIGRNCSKPPVVPYNWCAATPPQTYQKRNRQLVFGTSLLCRLRRKIVLQRNKQLQTGVSVFLLFLVPQKLR